MPPEDDNPYARSRAWPRMPRSVQLNPENVEPPKPYQPPAHSPLVLKAPTAAPRSGGGILAGGPLGAGAFGAGPLSGGPLAGAVPKPAPPPQGPKVATTPLQEQARQLQARAPVPGRPSMSPVSAVRPAFGPAPNLPQPTARAVAPAPAAQPAPAANPLAQSPQPAARPSPQPAARASPPPRPAPSPAAEAPVFVPSVRRESKRPSRTPLIAAGVAFVLAGGATTAWWFTQPRSDGVEQALPPVMTAAPAQPTLASAVTAPAPQAATASQPVIAAPVQPATPPAAIARPANPGQRPAARVVTAPPAAAPPPVAAEAPPAAEPAPAPVIEAPPPPPVQSAPEPPVYVPPPPRDPDAPIPTNRD